MADASLARALDEEKVDHAVHALLLLLGEPLSSTQSRRFSTMDHAVAKVKELLALQRNVALRPGLASATKEMPLSYSQLQMFTLQTLAPQSTAYNIRRAVRVAKSTRFDRTALSATCDALLAKHAVLRTVFTTDVYGEPKQHVLSLAHFKRVRRHVQVLEVDPSIMENDHALAECIASASSQPFDLASEAPIRVVAVTSSHAAFDWALAVVMHHIVTDPESSGVFWDDLEQLYSKFVSEIPKEELFHDELVQLEREATEQVTYRDFTQWQRLRLQSGLLAVSLQYWIHQLTHDEIPQLELPYDRSPQLASTPGDRQGSAVVFRSSPELQQAFSQLCVSQGASMFIGTMAVFHMLLSRVANCDDIIIGAPTAGRNHEALAGLMGFFVSTLPFRVKSKDEGDFVGFLQSVKELVVDGFSHMEIPLQKMLEHVQLERTSAQNSVFQVLFAWENGSTVDAARPMATTELPLPQQTAKFDLMLSMRYAENAHGQKVLEGTLEYPMDVFDRLTIERFTQYFLELATQVTLTPTSKKLSEIQMVPAAERQVLLRDWGSPPAVAEETPTTRFLDECVLHQVQQTPDNVALRFEGSEWTYQLLWHKSSQIASGLSCHGDQFQDLVGVRVGLFLDRGLDSIASIIGVLQARAVFIPLDPEFPMDRIQYMLENSEAEVVITQRHLVGKLEQLLAQSDQRDSIRILICEDAFESAAAPHQWQLSPIRDMDSADTIAYILYTSGSTGQPKGVMVTHANLLTTLQWTVREYHVGPDDMFLQSTSSTLDGSLTQLFSPLIAGASALITKKNGLHDLCYLSGLLTSHRVTFCVFVPSYFAMLIDFMGQFPQHVKHVVLAGEAFPTALATKFYDKHARFCEVAQKCVSSTCLVNEYGPTEASVTSTCFRYPCELAWSARGVDKQQQSIPIGRGVDDHFLVVLDKHKRLVPTNLPGELYVGGRGVAKGYWNRSDLTEKSFHHDELAWLHTRGELVDSDEPIRWYKTGDLVKWLPCGELLFLGRTDSQVKLRGMRIEPQEVRNVLLQSAAVKDAEVLVVRERLVAYVVPAKPTSASTSCHAAELQASLRECAGGRLPVHMVPHEIIIVDQWPRTPNGKLDLRALAQLKATTGYQECTSNQQDGGSGDAPDCAGSTMLVDVLKQAWSQVLDVDDDSTLTCASFFELGGNSLSAIRVISLVKPHGISLKLESFFRCKTLLEMAAACAPTLALDGCAQHKSTVIPLNWKPWAESSATAPPLFLIHCADGTVWKMMELARRLPFAVFGLQATHGGTIHSVEALAQLYWREIKAVQCNGPYRIGGFSFGCRIAHAVVLLGRREGAQFQPLTLLDGVPFHYADRPKKIVVEVDDATPEHQEQDAGRSVAEYVARALGYRPSSPSPHQSHEDRNQARDPERDLFEQLVANYASHCQLDNLYRPCASGRKCEESILAKLYKTAHWDIDADAYRSLGMDMEIVPVDGTHLTMLRTPHVESVVRAMVAAAQPT